MLQKYNFSGKDARKWQKIYRKVHFYIFTFLQRFDFLNLLIINSEIYKYYFIIIIYYIIIYNNIIYNNSL